jgi:predicted RNA-binding Zn ribbon-like protein
MKTDWRDGFLFVGNQLSLDFLNTKPVLAEAATELLTDCPALARWLCAAGLITPAKARRLEKDWSSKSQLTRMPTELREFRERLRHAVLQMEADSAPAHSFIVEVNRLLLAHPHIDEVTESETGLARGKRFDPETPRDIFAPVVDDVATLLALPDRSKLRMCRSCVLHFHDTSKKGTRSWCSMNLCGNRSKVAAYSKKSRIGVPEI